MTYNLLTALLALFFVCGHVHFHVSCALEKSLFLVIPILLL